MEECRLKNDTKGMARYAKQIERTEKELNRVTAVGKDFSNTLKNLDKASLKNLQSTLKQLKRQINGLEQGTDEWNRQAAAIRNVRARIDSIRSSLRATQNETKTFWQHLKEWQAAAVGLFGYVFGKMMGFLSYGRQVGEEFAAMQQEMANVRKYTGMSEKEVSSLNEAFMQLDTRTAREELNKYAQEAGRL
ncbi:MAG: hypothetical protein K2G67_06000 [Muribaculaceae bacterium]|nr:hypothetical protein [Muribaculaceae bacterium]